MATQLRLVDPPPTARTRTSRTPRPARTARATVAATRGSRRSGRRPVQWGDWQLDDRTRRIGREGVAAARRALEQAAADDALPRAS